MDAATQRALESIERRIDGLGEMMRHGWHTSALRRQRIESEIDALVAEVNLLKAEIAALRAQLESSNAKPRRTTRRRADEKH